jgi:citrate synthase
VVHEEEGARMATAQLDVDSNKFNLPVVKASAGPDGIVVSKLRNDGWVTLDPGFLTTAQCESKITYIDGKHSILRYCGYPIEQLCENSDFLEVAWLLRHGELPSRAEYEQFCADINHKTMVGEDFRTFMGSFPRSAHPMSVLASAINALATFYPDTTDISDNDQLDEAAKIIMAKARTIVSYIFRRRRDEPMLYPDYARGYVDDFLRMCFAVPYEPFESDPLYVHALGRLLIIHADHEQNCSTSVVRIAGSAHANLYSAVAAGVNALSGPLHGGANEAVLRQLKAIRDSGKSVAEFVRDAKENGQKISGLGHRVYKSYDPRAAIARKYLEKIMEREDTQKLPSDERALFAVATELEDIALNDEYFVSRNLYPNVDFYTGLIYRAIGFDPAMFTTLFALGRIPGWIAQYREMLADPNTKITPGLHRSGRARFRADGRAVIVGLRKRFAGDSSEALSICTAQTSYAATAA